MRTIAEASPSIVAFVGTASLGPVDTPVAVASMADFVREFGSFGPTHLMGYSVREFFLNGGHQAMVVRIAPSGTGPATEMDLVGDRAHQTGLYALLQSQSAPFGLLHIAPLTRDADLTATALLAALGLCVERRAVLLVDPPIAWKTAEDVASGIADLPIQGEHAANAAMYFPRLLQPDPADGGTIKTFSPCGAVAGVIARTDQQRGVWVSPAGQRATVAGAPELDAAVDDQDGARLQSLGVNSLRRFASTGTIVWGARTLAGADAAGSEWKYVPVRRTALFVEQSVLRGLSWAEFEPNDERLWAAIRQSTGAFLHALFQRGAFQGQTPTDAYFVRCGRDTTTQADIDCGSINVVVGFAALRPAEFAVVTIEQITGGAPH